MFIEIKQLEVQPLDFVEDFGPGVIDFGPDIQQKGGLHSAGRAQLIEERHGKHQTVKDIRLNGDFSTQVEVACARCLEPIVQEVSGTFDLLYRPQGSDAGKEEISITAAEAEISYYQGESLLLEDALREQVLLALPLKAICREDCKGMCPHCGKDLNAGPCGCAEVSDPRWTALKDLRSKLEQ